MYIGSKDSNLYALNSSTGTLVWNYSIDGKGIELSSPAVYGGNVYIGSLDGTVYAFGSFSYSPIDFNLDGAVNFRDITQFVKVYVSYAQSLTL